MGLTPVAAGDERLLPRAPVGAAGRADAGGAGAFIRRPAAWPRRPWMLEWPILAGSCRGVAQLRRRGDLDVRAGRCWARQRSPRCGLLALVGLRVACCRHLPPIAFAWQLADRVTGGWLLGLVTTAMLLGHWYLNTPTMKLAPLRRLIVLLAAAVLPADRRLRQRACAGSDGMHAVRTAAVATTLAAVRRPALAGGTVGRAGCWPG